MKGVPSHPVLDCAEAKAWEAGLLTTEAGEWDAMQRAGKAVAAALAADSREIGGLRDDGCHLILAGKGHNGGDALLAARALLRDHPRNRAVVVLGCERAALRPLTARSLDLLLREAPGRVELEPGEKAVSAGTAYETCLDGLFGFQFRPPLDASAAGLLGAVNAHPGIRLRAAVDLPSGVGAEPAASVFHADFTYATGIVKSPVLAPGVAPAVGRLRYLDLGFFDQQEPPDRGQRVLTPAALAPFARLRAARTDKRTYGHLLIAGGARSYPGAVVLAARAALRSGAGLVTVFVPERLAPEYAARHPEAMWVGCPETAAGSLAAGTADLIRGRLARATALLVGPGLGADAETLAWTADVAAQVTVPLVIDADALRPAVLTAVKDKPFICTPHAGEFERIASLFPAGRPAGRGVLVLKGPLTRVTDGAISYISPHGGPVLARGGSGDLLAGLIGGLLAQQPADPLLAACQGVVWHGRAADLLARARGQVAVEISEILEQLGPALTS